MSYHIGVNATFELIQLQNIGSYDDDVQFVENLKLLNEQTELFAQMSGNATLVLLWNECNAEEFLGRSPDQINAIKSYTFPQPNLCGNPVQG